MLNNWITRLIVISSFRRYAFRPKASEKVKKKINYYSPSWMICVYLEQMNTDSMKNIRILCFHVLLWYSKDVNCKWMCFFALLIRIGWTDFIGFDMLLIICITWMKLKLLLMDVMWCMNAVYFQFLIIFFCLPKYKQRPIVLGIWKIRLGGISHMIMILKRSIFRIQIKY